MNSPVNNLIIKGSITVYIMQDSEQSIFIQGNKSAVKQLKTTFKNRTLSLSKGYSLNDERINVFLTVNSLESIKTMGDVKIETPTNIWLNKLLLNLSEETEAVFFINSNQLDLNVSGSGDLSISGYIDTLKVVGTEESEIVGNIKSIKLSCRTSDFSNITFEGIVFKSFLSAFNQSSIDLSDCENGMSSVVSFDDSRINVTSIDVTDIYAFDKSSVHYRSANQALIMENSKNAQIKQETYKNIAKK